MKRIFVAFIFIFLSLQGSCFAARDVLVFFDVSGSTSKDTIQQYFTQYRTVVNSLKEGDSIACALINKNTRGGFAPFGTINIRTKGKLESPTGYKEETDSKKTGNLLQVKRKLEGTRPAGDTDILSSLTQAKDYFSGTPSDNRKILVLFSDMVEETNQLNLKNLKPSGGDKAFKKIQANLPALNGVSVYFAGAEGKTPEGFKALETFWGKVCQTCGAKVALFSKTLYKFE